MCDNLSFSGTLDSDLDTIVYEDPRNDKPFEECWKCWNYPEIKFKTPVTILNKKYCNLYPKRTAKKLHEIIPNFEDCKTLYTRCDFKLEACVHEQILNVESLLKSYEKTFEKEVKLQQELIEKIWEASTRFCLLRDSSPCIKFYPEIVSAPTERRTLCEFHENLKKLNNSNCRLRDFLTQINAAIEELNRRCNFLDLTIESSFLLGDGGIRRSLAYVRETINDLFQYFYTTFGQLRCWAQLIDPADTPAVEDYKSLLESVHDFDGFLINVQPTSCCYCRRAQYKDHIKRHKPCK